MAARLVCDEPLRHCPHEGRDDAGAGCAGCACCATDATGSATAMSGSIGGVDANIPLQAGRGVQQPNPLAQIGQFAQTQNALNENRLFPGRQQLQQQAFQGGQVDLQGKINQAVYGSLTPLLALPAGSITHDEVTTALASAERNLGLPTNGVLQHILAIGPSGDGAPWDAKVRTVIAAGAQPYASAAAQVTPQAGPVIDVGPTLQPSVVSPVGSPTPGVVSPAGGSYAKGLTPSEATAPTQVGMTPTGAPVYGTRGQFIERATGGQPSPLGTGRLPPALLNPNAPGASQPIPEPPLPPSGPTGAPTASPGVVTGIGPAQESALATRGATSAKAFQDIASEGVQARSQNATLGNMLADAAEFATGPEKINEGNKLLQRYTPSIAASFGITPQQVAANESFDKLANQIAGAQGERSDARLAVAQQANPGSHLSPAGVDLIIRQLQGNADYLQARAQLAAKFPDQSDRAAFESKIGSQLDPRAFQFARMTPQQKVTYYNGLSDADKAAVKAAYNNGVKLGILGNANGQ